MARTIALTRTPYRMVGDAVRYVYTAAASGSPTTQSEVFVMQQVPLNPTTGTRTANFFGVASPIQITQLPVAAPNPGEYLYRTATYEAWYANRDDADEDWVGLRASVQALLDQLTAGDSALAVETVTLVGG